MIKQVNYQIVLEDIAAFSLHHARTSKFSQRRFRFTQALGIFCILVMAIIWPRSGIVEQILFVIAFCLFWLIAYPIYYRWVIKRNARKIYAGNESKGVLGEHTIVIEAEGVTERSAVGESRTAWSGVDRVDDDAQNIYLYIGPLQAHVIPKRAFRTSDDAEAFLQLAQAYHLSRVE